MNLDEQLRAALDREAEMQQAPAPDVNRLISGGKVRRRRRSLVRFGVASVFAVVLVGGGIFVAEQIATSTDPESAQPPSATMPPELFTENLNLEPGTYRMVVGIDATGVEIVADLTFYGPDWISGPNPTVVADNGVHEYRARGGVGVYPPEALAGGSGCSNEATKASASTSQALAEQLTRSHGARSFRHPYPCRRSATTPFICACGSTNSAPQARATSSRRCHEAVAESLYGHNQVVIDFWVMDLNGTPVVVDSWYPEGSSGELVERVDETRKSVTFVDSE